MVRFTVAERFATPYAKALSAAGISFLFEMSYDDHCGMITAKIDVKDDDVRKAGKVLEQARADIMNKRR